MDSTIREEIEIELDYKYVNGKAGFSGNTSLMSVIHTLKICKKAVSKGQMLVGLPMLVTLEWLIPLYFLCIVKW
jgi:hypothetical protein